MPRATPARIGRYAIVRQIGQGGMGAVFLARDPAIDRLVAIKLMREEFENTRHRDRFAREAQAIGRIHHQNIVTVFDVGEHEGEPFIAMEYVEGRTLASVIAREETTLAGKLRIIDELCAGLNYAHRTGIVHRDIKPANIMVDTEGTVKILDFGIARGSAAGLTQSGMILGTMNYMSPEQLTNKHVDHRADIFAVGAVFYELLSGRQAFPGDALNVFHLNVNAAGPEPLPQVCPELDPNVIAIVERCLERDLNLRYADLGALRRDLAGVERSPNGSLNEPYGADGRSLRRAPRPAVSTDARTIDASDRDALTAAAVSLHSTRVFVSYAHTPSDTTFAKYVADRLRAAGFDVRLIEFPPPTHDGRKAAIEKAVADSSHALFIVSPSWLLSEWSALELELCSNRAGVRHTPILRAQRAQLALPPQLSMREAVEWPEDDPDYDARFWELHCAIRAVDPGSREGWHRQGRALAAIPFPTPPRPPRPTVRPSLRCDRTPQWTRMDDLATDGFNDLILLPGVAGQDHDHFVERIQCLLRMDPPRSMTRVDWPIRPRNRGECFELLAHALRVPPASLAEEIVERLAHENLILLHPCIRSRFEDDTLVRYYTDWLPELVSGRRPGMHLKCVQPIEWPSESRPVEQLLIWMRLRSDVGREGKPQAEKLIRLVRSAAGPVLRVVRLDDLKDITDEDLVKFCELVDLTGKQRQWFLSRIRSRNPARAKDVFQAIDDYLPDARSIT